MKISISNKVYNHLEFLGYKAEDLSSDNEEIDVLVGTQEDKSTLIIRILKNKLIILSSRLFLTKKKNITLKEFLNSLNKVNSEALCTKWYYEENNDDDNDCDMNIIIESSVFDYNKQTFSRFLNCFIRESSEYLKEFSNFYE